MDKGKKCFNCNDLLVHVRSYDHSLFCSGECKDAYTRRN